MNIWRAIYNFFYQREVIKIREYIIEQEDEKYEYQNQGNHCYDSKGAN